ncbi:MAG: hypothetical protein N3G22_00500 [Candidatus Micrarchaeota archaeon]|nr:hypothetical protein [Candidatus Micrarchaeota archaeon]
MQLNATEKMELKDYLDTYEKALKDVISACGSREAASQMLSEIEGVYEAAGKEIRKLDALYAKNPEMHAAKKAAVLSRRREEVERIIEKYAPHTSGYVKELILATSLATTALMLPLSYALSALAVATGVVAIGSSYYISFRLLKNWRAIAGKEKIASMVGKISLPAKKKEVLQATPGRK